MNDPIIPGVLYVQIENEIQKIGEMIDTPTIELADDSIPYDLVNLEGLKTSASFELSTKTSKEVFLMISGILDMALALCQSNRVCYLALYARKKRTRKKNIHRIFRILEKENDYAENQ
mgnify:CR=1 FL=1